MTTNMLAVDPATGLAFNGALLLPGIYLRLPATIGCAVAIE
jgi:hypothetical protein